MFELPLFPLNTVLFPGTLIHLHIFEERYKQMIRLCIEQQQPFGVTLIQHGLEAYGALAEPFMIGTTAKIKQVQRLPEGQMNIVAMGEERFKIINLKWDVEPYLVGDVESYPLDNSEPEAVVQLGLKLKQFLKSYLKTVAEAGLGQLDIDQLPDDAVSLANITASIIPLGNHQKQELLTIETAEELVKSIYQVLRRESSLLKAFLVDRQESQGSFSIN